MSQYFYVCCTWGRGDKELGAEGVEPGRIVETQLPEVPREGGVQKGRDGRRSTIMVPASARADQLKAQENLLRTKSAPIVKLEELENLL